MIWPEKWLLAGAVLAAPATAAAGETVSYTYDALGRLTNVSVSGGPNAGSAAATGYDPAGNRTNYSVSGAGPAGSGAASQSASSGEVAASLDEESIGDDVIGQDVIAEDIPPALVEPPPPGGIPDESEPVVEAGSPEVGDAAGADR
jgi:RHS repeat protein